MRIISNALTLFIIIALAVMVFHGKPEQQALLAIQHESNAFNQ